jgi:SSS family transporter
LEWHSLPVENSAELVRLKGAFFGSYQDYFILAGGKSNDDSTKNLKGRLHDDIWLIIKENENYKIESAGRLDQSIAFGSSVSTKQGIVCIGGLTENGLSSSVFRLKWDDTNRQVVKENLPPLPQPVAYGSALYSNGKIYFAGGINDIISKNTTLNFWMLDPDETLWKLLPSWPGKSRALAFLEAQHDGQTEGIYIAGGLNWEGHQGALLKDIYEFIPSEYEKNKSAAESISDKKVWRRRLDSPESITAGTGLPISQGHICVIGENIQKTELFPEVQQSIKNKILYYHTITNTWLKGDDVSINNIATNVVNQDGQAILLASDSDKIHLWRAAPQRVDISFGLINFVVLVLYLIGMVAIGAFFSTKNKSTDDFFRGGQRVPWWASGFSIFATMLSSITFLAIPAKAYATDWVFFMINMAAVIVAPFVVFYILPFFRNIDATSAYEYLEKRFNIFLRLFGSASFIIFQIGRMAIVMFLPALALATITPLSVQQCILIMGVLSVIYCTMGGVRAVIWTDTIQTFVLLGGALLSYILIISSLNGGFSEFWSIASAQNKFNLLNWNWSTSSFSTTAFWIVLLGGLGQQLVPYASDQAVVQRYMAVRDKKSAARAIWTNAITVIPASLIFFGIGTALFVFYKTNPAHLDPTFQTDAIFALFIARELPVGIAGLVVAGIFAAAQSTISTSMNSTSTAIVTDFVRRFDLLKSEKAYLRLARILTFILGCLGTALALLFVASDVKSLWDSFMAILGLFGGSMCGLFLLGIFTKRTNGFGALIGAILGAVTLALAQQYSAASFLLYASIGILVCFISGYLASLFTPRDEKSLEGLTIFTSKSN